MADPTVTAVASCFRGEKYLPAFLENVAEQTIASETEIVLVHNDPSERETAMVADFIASNPGLIEHVVIPREPLAVSTNRALAMARGRYVCIWNVDDLRTPDSLELMARTLDRNPGAGFTYGDYAFVDTWRSTDGARVTTPAFDRREFVRSMMLGPFYMWRKSLCDEFGLWDEQLRMGADFDWAIRLALAADGVKTDGLLGYYLNEGAGLSTGPSTWQPVERTVLELRYGIYDKVDAAHYRPARKYRLDAVLRNGEWIPLSEVAPGHRRFARSPLWLGSAGLRWLGYAAREFPGWLLRRVRGARA
jgi:glycosyltransferase involved in cell wall biosynthesis